MFKRIKKNKGFTLLEIVVVLAIFSLLTTIIVDVYLLALRAQRQTSFQQLSLSSARYVTEVIAKEIRKSDLNYNYSGYQNGGLTSPVGFLALLDQDGNEVVFSTNAQGAVVLTTGGQNYLLTNPDDLTVTTFNFYIQPLRSPFNEERCSQDIGINGCAVTSLPLGGCTINDGQFPTGFCQCDSNDDCQKTQYCNLAEGVCLPPDQQPLITMTMAFVANQARQGENQISFLQTTVSSRVYKR